VVKPCDDDDVVTAYHGMTTMGVTSQCQHWHYSGNIMKKIFVTGADGFIGSHLVEHLVRAGYQVRPYVLYNSFNSWGWLDHVANDVKKELDVIAGDVRDADRTQTAMKGCDVVMHLASLIAIPYSYHAPSSYVDTNVKGTLNVVHAARELAIEKVIHTSTSEVYGTAQFVPITEGHPLQGQSPYSATKIAADQIAMSYYCSFQTPVIILRPFNTYGPRQSNRAIIPTIITQIAAGKCELSLGSLTPTRDLNFIADTVAAFLAVLQSDKGIGEVINIGSNYEITVQNLVLLIARLMEVDVVIRQDKNRIRPAKSEVERLWASNQKAQQLIDWAPRYAGIDGLKSGLIETIDWFNCENNLKLYKSEIYNV